MKTKYDLYKCFFLSCKLLPIEMICYSEVIGPVWEVNGSFYRTIFKMGDLPSLLICCQLNYHHSTCKQVDPQRLFSLSEHTSPVTRDILQQVVGRELPPAFGHVVWTFNLRRLAVLVGESFMKFKLKEIFSHFIGNTVHTFLSLPIDLPPTSPLSLLKILSTPPFSYILFNLIFQSIFHFKITLLNLRLSNHLLCLVVE